MVEIAGSRNQVVQHNGLHRFTSQTATMARRWEEGAIFYAQPMAAIHPSLNFTWEPDDPEDLIDCPKIAQYASETALRRAKTLLDFFPTSGMA
jgi:hypothetical protein